MKRNDRNRRVNALLTRLCAGMVMLAAAACAQPDSRTGGGDPPDAGLCGNHVCDQGETPSSCAQDCSACGNGTCDQGETPSSCPRDCDACGNGTCDAGETVSSCPQDCSTCGNGRCDTGETAASCPQDCATCGDGICDGNETASGCPQDCARCGDNVCESGETVSGCPVDCAATLIAHNISSYVIYHLYVYPCGAPSEGTDQLGASVILSGGQFTLGAIPPGCYLFHASSLTDPQWRTPAPVILSAGLTYTWTLTN